MKYFHLMSVFILCTHFNHSMASNKMGVDIPSSVDSEQVLEFARQAGTIAGIVKACGQNLDTFNQRAEEVLALLSSNPMEKEVGLILFKKMTEESQKVQKQSPTLSCHHALSEYQKVPLLRSDYKTQVLEKLNSHTR